MGQEQTEWEEYEPQDIFDRVMGWKILRFMQPFYKKNKDTLLYLFFGGLTTLVNVVASLFFMDFLFRFVLPVADDGLRATVSNVLSIILAILFAYVTNKIWVFRSKTHGGAELFFEFVRFVGGRLSTMAIEVGGVVLLYNILHWPFLAAKLLTQIIVVIGNYFISKFLVFRGRGTSNSGGKRS